MSSFNRVTKFECSIEQNKNPDIVHFVIKINDFDYFRFPYYKSNISSLNNSFKHIINGKDKTIDLNFNLNYNLIKFEKDRIMISLLNENTNVSELVQEFRIFFENNSIVRNALREFIHKNQI